MKLQHLSIVFVIIILPISLVLSVYIQAQTTALGTQIEYDGRLISATYDAMQAFQMNTLNNSTANVANSKIRDIEASANSFFTALSANFGMSGYATDTLKSYVPALVYTMYDGYYIYTPFTNKNDYGINNDGETVYGLKPYVYYSCRYIQGSNDIVINYSLDNYIAVQGTIDGKYVNVSGYLMDSIKYYSSSTRNGELRGSIYQYYFEYYSNVIGNKTMWENGNNYYNDTEMYILKQSVPGHNEDLPYIKENGTTYYLDEANGRVFYLLNGVEREQAKSGSSTYEEYVDKINHPGSATQYYSQVCEFTEWARSNLSWVSSANAYNLDGTKLELSDNSGIQIFKEDSNIPIEYDNSPFNVHRLAVIRNSIETNLATVIASYNRFTDNSYDYQMPKLREDEWDLIMNNASLISFLQGLYTGGNIYNGYAIVTNNATKETVREEDIYIVVNNEYHRITDTDLLNANLENAYGGLNLDFMRKSAIDSNGNTIYYYPYSALGCYNCIVNQSSKIKILGDGGVYEYLDSLEEDSYVKLKRIYYTALGRERYGMTRISYMQLDENGNPIY